MGLAPGPGFRYSRADGGFDVPLLSSARAPRGHDGRARGLDGRALQAGDRLSLGEPLGTHRRSPPLPHGRETGVLPCLGGSGDARPAGGPGTT